MADVVLEVEFGCHVGSWSYMYMYGTVRYMVELQGLVRSLSHQHMPNASVNDECNMPSFSSKYNHYKGASDVLNPHYNLPR